MIEQIISTLTNFIVQTISTLGYPGVALLMAIESACIPLPSEIIMPFAGYLVYTKEMTLFGAALAGAVGNLLGSILTYWVGYWGGRPLVQKYGKWLFISNRDVQMADRFFARFGSLSVFLGRLLPVVRTFISVPAGIFKENFWKFCLYTFVGSFIWSLFLAYLGLKLGENWNNLRDRLHGFDVAVIAMLILAAGFWIWRHIRHIREERRGQV